MKTSIASILLLLLLGATASAQDTLFLNSKNEIVKNRKQAEHFKVITNTDTGYVMQILNKDLVLESKTTFKDSDLKIRDGYHTSYVNKQVDSEGRYLGDKRNGLWKYYLNGSKTASVIYNSDDIDSAQYFKSTGEPETDPSKIRSQPSFPGGMPALGKYLQQNLKYPRPSGQKKGNGTVIVQFVVTASGEITDIEVVTSVAPELDREAMRVVRQMPTWIPGIQFGRPVNVKYKMPIAFAWLN